MVKFASEGVDTVNQLTDLHVDRVDLDNEHFSSDHNGLNIRRSSSLLPNYINIRDLVQY